MCLDEENIQLACVLVVPGFQIVPRKEQNNSQSHILNLWFLSQFRVLTCKIIVCQKL